MRRRQHYLGIYHCEPQEVRLAWNPDVVLLVLGSNDTKKRNWDPEIFRRDYKQIVQSYLKLPSEPRVILITPILVHRVMGIPLLGLYPETMEEGVRPAIHEIAKELGWPADKVHRTVCREKK